MIGSITKVAAAAAAGLALLSAVGCRGADDSAARSSADRPESVQVVIVGAGIAGLVTARELTERGIDVRVLEMSSRVGGRVATAEYPGGLRAEYGMEELWSGNPLIELAGELGVALEPPLAAYSSVLIDGELHSYDHASADDYLEGFLTREDKRALDAWMRRAGELVRRADSVGLADTEIASLQSISFETWITERSMLPSKVASWIRLTLDCELASDWSEYSALFGLMEFRIFLDGGVPNYHVRGGNSVLIHALAATLKDRITLDARVAAIRRPNAASGSRAVVSYERNRRVHRIEADRVVVTVPWTHLHRIVMDPPISPDRWRAINTLGRGSYVVVHFVMDAAAHELWNRDGAVSLPLLTEGPLGVVYGVQASNEDELIFGLLVYGGPARAFHMIAQDTKLAELTAQLEALWPGFARYVKQGYVYPYHPAAVAVWPPGRSPLDAGSDVVRRPQQGVYLAGDWTLGSHSSAATTSALRIAEQIASELSGE